MGQVDSIVLRYWWGISPFDYLLKVNWSNSLPKLSLIRLFPPETAGYRVGRIYGRTDL